MDKEHILSEIHRTAEANGGVPLGRGRFLAETGIKEIDWRGKYWARWGDALKEAGYSPLALNPKLNEEAVLDHLVALVREHGRFPTQAEMRLRRRADTSFPSDGAIARLGTKNDLIVRVIEHCRLSAKDVDVLNILTNLATAPSTPRRDTAPAEDDGFVYLIQSGRFYKIGKTNSLGRRERELAIQLPDKAVTVHSIKTDDATGIEAYWHRRFENRRKNGEWFELSKEDVRAFKRRKFM